MSLPKIRHMIYNKESMKELDIKISKVQSRGVRTIVVNALLEQQRISDNMPKEIVNYNTKDQKEKNIPDKSLWRKKILHDAKVTYCK